MTSFTILRSVTFGEWSRYKLSTCRDRFGTICYIVTDAERTNEYGMPETIRQEWTEEAARKGLSST